jgi:hypothetical protein
VLKATPNQPAAASSEECELVHVYHTHEGWCRHTAMCSWEIFIHFATTITMEKYKWALSLSDYSLYYKLIEVVSLFKSNFANYDPVYRKYASTYSGKST